MTELKYGSMLAIDPGPHLGWVRFHLYEDKPPVIQDHGLIYPATWADIPDVYNGFMVQNYRQAPPIIVCEDWIDIPYQEHTTDNRDVQQQLGVLQYLCYFLNRTDLELPHPQSRLQITDETLKSSQYWLSGKDYDHVRQATKHGLAWLVRNNHRPTQRRLYPRED